MTYGLKPFALSAVYMEISNLGKLATSSGADSNENNTSVYRVKSQGLTVPRIYGVNDHAAEVEVPGYSTIL